MRNRYIYRAHISEISFRKILKCFCLDVSAMTAAGLLNMRRQTVQRIYSLLRSRIVALAVEEARPFAGDVEVDESYFGAKRVRGKRGRGAGGKTPVIGLHKRGERVFVSVVENCSKRELMPVIRGHVLTDSDIYIDGWKAYDGLVTGGYKHHRVHHHENEFVRGKNHVNGIESFWSFAKFRMTKLRGVQKHTFLIHLKECEWRWNHRHHQTYKLMLSLLRTSPL